LTLLRFGDVDILSDKVAADALQKTARFVNRPARAESFPGKVALSL
jgi:hypothetical protein